MNVSKILIGEGAERHLPFALSKLRALKLQGRAATVQKFVIDDATIIIEFNPAIDRHIVRIERSSGVVGYEFFSTEDSVTSFPVDWWATAVVPRKINDEWALVPRKLSSAFASENPPVVPRDPLSRAVNGQRNAQYHWWPMADGVQSSDPIRTKPYFMTSTNGCFSWHAPDMDFQNFMGSYTTVTGLTAVPHDFLTDVGVDVQPTIYEKGRAKSGFPFPVLPNWPRRAACMEVAGRRFVIMTDMQSNFYAYPEEYLTGDPVNLAFHESRAVVVGPADYMPASVAKPTMATMHCAPRGVITEYGLKWAAPPMAPAPVLAPYSANPGSSIEPGADEVNQYQKHHYLWDFHPSGQRAVAVVHVNKRQGMLFDTGAGGLTAYCLREYGPQYLINPDDVGRQWVQGAGGAEPFDVTERGVLEVDFHIQITGERPQDFTFSVTTRRLISGGWFFDAQYAYCDARLEARGVLGGDLLTDEIRLRGVPTGGAGARPTIHDEFIVTMNQDRGVEAQSVCVAMNRPYEMLLRTRSVETVAVPTYAGSPPSIRRHFILEPSSTGPHGLARLIASDLRSLSRVFEQSRDGASVGLHAVVFGEHRQGASLPLTEADAQALGHQLLPSTFLPSGSYWLGGDTVAPNSLAAAHALGLHRLAWDNITYRYGFDASVHTGITTHPDGHFAVFACFKNPFNPGAAVTPFDLIEHRRVEGGVEVFNRTTHAEAFEAAFGIPFDLQAFVTAMNTATPFVLQRFASWRNIKLPKLPGGNGSFGLNPAFDSPAD